MFTEATQCRVLMQHLGGKKKKGKKNKSLYLLSIRQNVCLPGKQEFKMTNRSCTETQTKVNKDLFMCVRSQQCHHNILNEKVSDTLN